MTSAHPSSRALARALAGPAVAALLFVSCDGLVTKPSLYGSVDVQITQRNGTPIEGASLILYTGQRPMGYATTDATGQYVFREVPPGVYGVLAGVPPGYKRLEDVIASPPTDFVHQLTLRGGESLSARLSFLKEGFGTIVGDVKSTDGTPVPNTPVTLYTSSGVLRSATTDAAGRFAFDDLPLGNYGVFAIRPSAFLDIGEAPPISRDGIVVDDGSTERADFQFAPCKGTITAIVRDNLGNPVPGAVFALYRASIIAEGQGGAAGSHAFSNLDCANYGVRVTVPIGWTAPEGRGVSFNDGLLVHRAGALSTTLNVQFVACRGTLRVRVQDGASAAVASARVILYTGAIVYRDVTTAADGQVVLDQIPCDREYGVMVLPGPGYTVVAGRGVSFFDAITFTNGAVVDRTLQVTRP